MRHFWKDGFYNDQDHGGNIPEGAEEITAQYREQLLQADADGKLIITDPDTGHPIAVEPWETLDLEQLIARKQWEIHQMRDQRMTLGIVVNSYVLDTDPQAVVNINGAATMALIAQNNQTPFAVTWTSKNNEYIELTGAQVLQVAAALGSYVDAVHQAARELKDTVATLTDVAAINGFDYSGNWPSILEIVV